MSKQYEALWCSRSVIAGAESIEEMICMLAEAVKELNAMRAAGITLDPEGGTEDGHALLVTSDPVVAEEFGLEIMEADDDEDETFLSKLQKIASRN
jgi:hypothetical protein